MIGYTKVAFCWNRYIHINAYKVALLTDSFVSFLLFISLYQAVLSVINASEYQYQYDNKTCIKVRTDVVFTLTNWKEIITFDGTNFTVISGDCALPGESNAILRLATIKEDYLILIFQYDAQNQASMGATFTFSPYEYFPGTPTPSEYYISFTNKLL